MAIRIVKWIAVAGGVLSLLAIILISFSMNRYGPEMRRFESEHADASRQTREIVGRSFQSPTSATAARRGENPVDLVRGLDAFNKSRYALEAAYSKVNRLSYLAAIYNLDNIGVQGIVLALPAAAFSGTGATINAEALRTRIQDEVKKYLNANTKHELFELQNTSPAIIANIENVMNDAGRLLKSPWQKPAPGKIKQLDLAGVVAYGGLALERAAQIDQREEAGQILAGLIRVQLANRIVNFPAPAPLNQTQGTILRMAERGGLSEGSLERVERLLAQGRLGEEQLKALRADHVLRVERYLGEGEESDMSLGERVEKSVQAGSSRIEALIYNGSEQVFNKFLRAQFRPIGLAWAGGDAAAYDKALRNPLIGSYMYAISVWIYPMNCGAFGTDGVNDELDFTRLIVAAARHRLITGRDPEQAGDLAPRFLDPSLLKGPALLRGVERFAAFAGADGKNRPARTIYYEARRRKLNPRNFLGAVYALDNYQSFSDVKLNVHSALGTSASDISEEVIVVRMIWLNPEALQRDLLGGLKNSSNQTSATALKK